MLEESRLMMIVSNPKKTKVSNLVAEFSVQSSFHHVMHSEFSEILLLTSESINILRIPFVSIRPTSVTFMHGASLLEAESRRLYSKQF